MNHRVAKALIYMAARNCEMYVANALASLARQTHDDLHVLFVDDSSTDATALVARRHLEELFPHKHTFIRNDAPWGKARNAHVHLRSLLGIADFVAVLDGDDELVDPTILGTIAGHYAAGFDVVWTNYVTDRGVVGPNGPLDPLSSPRGQGWKTSHFFTFRAELLANVDERYFKDGNGRWLLAACDMALAYPVLDQTRRYAYIPVQAYRYTDTNPRSHHNASPSPQGGPSMLQRASAREILQKPPLPCTRAAMGVSALPEDGAVRYSREDPKAEPVEADRVDGIERNLSHGVWQQAAALQLAERCPALLDLAMCSSSADQVLDVMQAWWLLRLAESGRARPRVLEVGAGPWAAPLAAIVESLHGRFWVVTGDGTHAEQLFARLDRSRAASNSTVLTGGNVRVEVSGTAGLFPDLSVLGGERDFDMVVVSLATPRAEQVSRALVALPAAAGHLSRDGFAFCLLTDWRELRNTTTKFWRRLSPDLHYDESGCAGHAVVVTGG